MLLEDDTPRPIRVKKFSTLYFCSFNQQSVMYAALVFFLLPPPLRTLLALAARGPSAIKAAASTHRKCSMGTRLFPASREKRLRPHIPLTRLDEYSKIRAQMFHVEHFRPAGGVLVVKLFHVEQCSGLTFVLPFKPNHEDADIGRRHSGDSGGLAKAGRPYVGKLLSCLRLERFDLVIINRGWNLLAF